MTERLANIRGHIESVRQLSLVVSAMRNIAASRAREAREHLAAIESYAGTISASIADALGLASPPAEAEPTGTQRGARIVLAICAEQGFAGAFSERVLEAALRHVSDGAEMMIVGHRGLALAAEKGLSLRWHTAMIGHIDQTAGLADRVTDALFRTDPPGRLTRVDIVHAVPGSSGPAAIRDARLVPFDFSRFPPKRAVQPPLLTLPADVLLSRLAEEYMFAELCAAIVQSFAGENDARLRAMTAAHSHIEVMLESLAGRARQVRQEEITAEILELITGRMAGREVTR